MEANAARKHTHTYTPYHVNESSVASQVELSVAANSTTSTFREPVASSTHLGDL